MSRNVPVPRTGVPLGIDNPVERARAELKATLAAIEDKANLPRRLGRATDERVAALRRFSRRYPVVAAAGALAAAAAIGGAVWGAVRLYSR
jgi:hypothetical protein